jgi:hypothetical protein
MRKKSLLKKEDNMSKEKLNKKNQNYTIESLEPRYMMSADAPIDFSVCCVKDSD